MRVDRPVAPRSLSGQDIILSPDGRRILIADQARWSDALPLLVQKALIDQLGGERSLVAINTSSGVRADYRLLITIKDFKAVFDNGVDNAPRVHVHYNASLATATERELIAVKDFSQQDWAQSHQVSSIVATKDRLNSVLNDEIAAWVNQQITNSSNVSLAVN